MDGDKGDEKAETWVLNLSTEELDRLDGLERARKAKTYEHSKDKPQNVDGDFLHYLFCKENLSGKKMVRWADFEDWHRKMAPLKPKKMDWSSKAELR